jgi:hypothetical protein
MTRREHFAALGRLSMASRTPEQRSAFARIGSLTAARNGTQHRWTQETAKRAVAARLRKRAATEGDTK